METENNNQTEVKQFDLTPTTKAPTSGGFGYKSLFLVVILSLLTGMGGGVYGALFLTKNPTVANWLKATEQQLEKVSAPNSPVYIEESDITQLVEKVSPAVVSILVKKDVSAGKNIQFSPLFGFSLSPGSSEPNFQQVGAGTGFFVSDDGLIMTNRHVVEDKTASYSVITNTGESVEVKLVAVDPVNDLAILKADTKPSAYLDFADSSSIKLGQQVVAIGNSLGEYQNTVTSGIISGIGRSITAGGSGISEQLDDVVQTDAAINPGNSGGPLLNLAGQVVGMNTAVDLQGQLVGFAIPSNDIKKALESYKDTGRIVRPYLGVRYLTLNQAIAQKNDLAKETGALILRGNQVTDFAVLPGSPADQAGLQENDIIMEINGVALTEKNNLTRELKRYRAGDKITMKVYSRGQEKMIEATLGETK